MSFILSGADAIIIPTNHSVFCWRITFLLQGGGGILISRPYSSTIGYYVTVKNNLQRTMHPLLDYWIGYTTMRVLDGVTLENSIRLIYKNSKKNFGSFRDTNVRYCCVAGLTVGHRRAWLGFRIRSHELWLRAVTLTAVQTSFNFCRCGWERSWLASYALSRLTITLRLPSCQSYITPPTVDTLYRSRWTLSLFVTLVINIGLHDKGPNPLTCYSKHVMKLQKESL